MDAPISMTSGATGAEQPVESALHAPSMQTACLSNDTALTPGRRVYHRLTSLPKLGAFILAVYLVVALVAPILPLQSAIHQDHLALLAPPSPAHWFGTDQLGRDIFARVVLGARSTMFVAVLAVAFSTLIGSALGMISGYFGSWCDSVIMRVIDILLAMPSILFAISISAALGNGIRNTTIALAIIGIPRMARVARAVTIVEREQEYIKAAESVGVRNSVIIVRHVAPNVSSSIIVQATVYFAIAILLEASLSFLGMGVQVPHPALGSMLAEGRPYFAQAWWYAFAPGLAIVLLIGAVNSVADRLRHSTEARRNG